MEAGASGRPWVEGRAVFLLPAPEGGRQWRRLIDTATWAEPHGNCWAVETADIMSTSYGVHGFSVAVFEER